MKLLSLLLLCATAFADSPKPNDVCFSPTEGCDQKLVAFVKTAQKSIDVAIYDINLDQLVHELLVASRTKTVRIIVDKKQSKGSHSLVDTLVAGGANVRYGHQRGIMHNKFTLVDGKMLETGSFNYTNHASEANNENQIYLDNPDIVLRYKNRFEQIWSDATPVETTIRETLKSSKR